jgi:glutathione peroxidase
MSNFYDFPLKGIDGSEDLLGGLRHQVALVVNVASECGYTPQYKGLEKLHRELGDQGLTVIGIPCNQFGAQEPGSHEEIQRFCTEKYEVSFPLSEKIDVNGDTRHSLYGWLTDEANGFPGDIEWNFEKFLIDSDGKIRARYPAATTPDDAGLLLDISTML